MRSKARFTNTRISASELAGLAAAPVLLVPPPGPNKAIIYLDAVASVKLHGDAALDIGDCQIGYVHADVDGLLSASLFASYVADSEVIHYAPSIALAGLLLDVDLVENIGLYLHQVNASAVPGSVVSYSLAAAGTLYEEDDVIAIAGGATFTVLTVVAETGVISTLELTDPGETVEVGVGIATTGGAGSGATITVTAIDASAQHAEVNLKVWYDIFNIDT